MLDRTRFDWIAEAEAKTDEALALVKRMVDWFFATFEEHSGRDGYFTDAYVTYDEWIDEPRTTREGLDGQFDAELATFDDIEREEIIAAAVDEIEQGGCRSWTEKPAPANIPLLRP